MRGFVVHTGRNHPGNYPYRIAGEEEIMTEGINLHLAGHCIETEAKNELKRLMDDYFDEKGDMGDLEVKMELLRGFLSDSDFAMLRSSDERLSGLTESRCVVTKNPDGTYSIKFSD